MLLLAGPALLAGCGDGDPTITSSGGGQAAASTTAPGPTVAPREYPAELTTSEGYKYLVTLSVASQPATATADECAPAVRPAAGMSTYPVTLTVRNQAADRTVPFPPMRIEHASPGEAAPRPVMVKEPGGTCTFMPRPASIAPGATVSFRGTSPAVAAGGASGSAGRIEVSVSESRFSVVAPLP